MRIDFRYLLNPLLKPASFVDHASALVTTKWVKNLIIKFYHDDDVFTYIPIRTWKTAIDPCMQYCKLHSKTDQIRSVSERAGKTKDVIRIK